ncbi:hypothetical protein COV18_02045 [Candidatus Woesearchaeota archaeon CG10_big_fil_rev_8_21_14_0_10_37_12]|nr:MAG: hypothetical protein COV18_02045 [Candidatus Woesearchaeota archaeon CG10_big_fil_rev_8_21_14_0_10_37_12]
MVTDRKQREKKLHQRLAHEYDERREGTKTGRYYSKEWLRYMIKKAKVSEGSTVLDIGCGTGILYEVLREEGLDCKYIGADLSPEMISVGKKRYPSIDLRIMDSEKLDFPDKSVDFIFMKAVLHHLPNPVKALSEMKRVAKKTVIVSEPLNNILTELPRYLLKKLTNHFDEDHTHFSSKEMKNMLAKTHIKNAKVYYFGYLAYPWGFTDILPGTKFLPLFILKGLFKLDLLLEYVPLLSRLSWQIIVVCDFRKE